MKKDQFVIACVDDPQTSPIVIAYARHYAEHLRHKGLMLLNVSDNPDAEWINALDIPHVALRGDWRTAISALPTTFGGILAVAAFNPEAPTSSLTNPRSLLRAFNQCKIAYLCIPHNDRPTHLHLPRTASLIIDHQRESKEKLIWASYLARFLGSQLELALPPYRDQALLERQNNNLRFAEKFFQSTDSDIRHTIRRDISTLHSETDLLNRSTTDLLIALTTDPRRNAIAYLLGHTPERRHLQHPSHTPLLFLNPRDDLYVLCD